MPAAGHRPHPLNRSVARLALLAVLALASACHVDLSTDVEARDEWKRTYTLGPGGTFELRNTNGKVRITTGDGDTIDVKADRIIKAASEEAAKDALKQFEITEAVTKNSVTIDSTSRGSGFTIRLQRRVDFDVKVPRWADVRIDSTNSDIEVSGLQGPFRAETTNGRITGSALEGGARIETTNGLVELDVAKLTDAGISCETTNGRITVSVPRDARAQISARVTNGAITTSDLQLTVAEQSRRRLDASIGGGGPPIRLETTNGSIAIRGR
jgi:DUF4097 and DUF4098 domain-containing protein YvlB